MATAILVPHTSAGRPPTFRPPLTTFSPDDGDDSNYLVERATQAVVALEHASKFGEHTPEDLLDLAIGVKSWIESLLAKERMLYPAMLPPGIGTLYSMDELLKEDSIDAPKYVSLLFRLEELTTVARKEIACKRMFSDWDEPCAEA